MVLDGVVSSRMLAKSEEPLTLSLQNNFLIEIPSSIYELKNLHVLQLQQNFIKKQRLSVAQFAFLSNLSRFEIDADAFERTGCENVITFKSNPNVSICDPSTWLLVPPNSDSSGTSATQNLNKEQSSPSAKWSAWFGGIGSVLVVAAIVGIAMKKKGELKQFLLARRPHSASQEVNIFRDSVLLQSDAECYRAFHDRSSNSSSSLSMNEQLLESWRRDPRLIVLQKPLGSKGQKSRTWLGSYRGDDIVVKHLRDNASDSDRSLFVFDMKAAARFSHPNLIKFCGVAWSKDAGMQALVEYMDRGDLQVYLALSRGRSMPHAWWGTRLLEIALDIAQALLYLHTMQRASHCALTSRHVLLNHEFSAKLSSFMYVQYLSEYGVTPSVRPETRARSCSDCVRWSAPEVLSDSAGSLSEAVDIYSFGIILSELDTLEYPFERAQKEAHWTESELLAQLSQGKLTPSISQICPSAHRELLLACVAKDPSDRPTAAVVVQTLREIAAEINRESSITATVFSDTNAVG